MFDQGTLIFIGLIFAAVFFLSQGLTIPVFGENSKARKRLKMRMEDIDKYETDIESMSSLMRSKYLQKLSPLEQRLENLPYMEGLAISIEQAGGKVLAYRLVLISILLAVAVGVVSWELWRIGFLSVALALFAGTLPFLKISRDRAARFAKFEQQLPDAVDVIRRALLAGHPFVTGMKLVAEDMQDPAAKEFSLTFADINYGNDVRHAMIGLLTRVPSVTVTAFVTAVLVQKETGGNLAEILKQISTVIRGRFKFQRKVQTLSAEGRMSAWVLAMVPIGLFAYLSITNPDYLPVLLEDELGKKLTAFAAVWSFVGIYFIRRIIRIEV
jgi:tight adherence protein B